VLSTGLFAEMSGVTYCNLMLRPVAYQVPGVSDNRGLCSIIAAAKYCCVVLPNMLCDDLI
jgi:hypothetical protein